MKLEHQIEQLQALRASEWMEILKRGRPEDQAAFREWCRQSPQHVQEFLEISWMEQALDGLDPDNTIDLGCLLHEASTTVRQLPARREVAEVAVSVAVPASTRQRAPARIRAWGVAAGLAGLIVFGLGAAFYWHPQRSTEAFATKVGELRTVELVDASVVTLNTDSEITVTYEAGARNIDMPHGEAVFKVAHDRSRPFRVHTQAGTVQAVGTQFNVYADRNATEVSVLEGRVRLIPARQGRYGGQIQELGAGEQARIEVDGSIHRIEHADVDRVTAWSKRWIKFDETPLEEVVHEFNRYHRNLRLTLEGVAPGSHHYSGIFDADDPEMLATFLEKEPDLAVERRDGEIVIRTTTPIGYAATE